MDLTLTEDQKLVQNAAAGFLASRSEDCGARAARAEPSGYSKAVWKEMAELGWTGLALPESHGGAGAGFLEACLLIEELGAHQVPSPFLPTVVCAALPIARFGTVDQRQRWLDAIAQGRVMSYVRAAPRGRWRVEGSEVAATVSGDGFTLDGTAWFVPYADAAEELVVVAESDPSGKLTVFVVDADSPGISCVPLEVVGNEPQYRVEFTGVAVPASRVLGQPGAGVEVVEAISALGAAATCVEMVGGARRVLEMTVEHARLREQFGKPIGSFQAVQQHCADMAVDVLGSRLIAYEAVWRLSEGLDAGLEVASAKAWVSEAYQRVCARGHQVHGAIGFTQEHDLHFYLRHAVASSSAFGDGGFHTEQVARELGI
jgi:alkylation response protein AidB-like acyl-CoA dehydrogenase